MDDSLPCASYSGSSPSLSVAWCPLLAPGLSLLVSFFLPLAASLVPVTPGCTPLLLPVYGWGKGGGTVSFPGPLLPSNPGSYPSQAWDCGLWWLHLRSSLTPGLLPGLALLDRLALAAPHGRKLWPQRGITAQQSQSFSLAHPLGCSSDHPPLEGHLAMRKLPKASGACREGGVGGGSACTVLLPPKLPATPSLSFSPTRCRDQAWDGKGHQPGITLSGDECHWGKVVGREDTNDLHTAALQRRPAAGGPRPWGSVLQESQEGRGQRGSPKLAPP